VPVRRDHGRGGAGYRARHGAGRPSGARALNHPSLALPLPNGNILVNDDRNDRVNGPGGGWLAGSGRRSGGAG